jgi:ABC-type glutathione transport system ATPase component
MLLEADGVEVAFGGGIGQGPRRLALCGVSLALPADRPSILAVVGESGSGKTTLTRLMLGLLEPGAGTVRYLGRDIARRDQAARAIFRREVQAVFQDPFSAFNPFYPVDRMLVLPARRFGLAASRREAYGLAEEALTQVGLRPAETLGRYPHQLSGGQRQRLMVARALMLRPRVIVADEPVSMVDASLRATILQSLHKLVSEFGISMVYVTHDLATAYQVADRIAVMRQGRVVEEGDAVEVIRRPRHAYTRALVDAIPPADPTVPWGLEDGGEPEGEAA